MAAFLAMQIRLERLTLEQVAQRFGLDSILYQEVAKTIMGVG